MRNGNDVVTSKEYGIQDKKTRKKGIHSKNNSKKIKHRKLRMTVSEEKRRGLLSIRSHMAFFSKRV